MYSYEFNIYMLEYAQAIQNLLILLDALVAGCLVAIILRFLKIVR